MAEALTIARPYAKAVFETAIEAKRAVEWLQVLQVMAAVVKDPAIHPLLNNPEIARSKVGELIVNFLEAECSELVKTLGEHLKNFIKVLASAKRFSVLPSIALLFQKMYSELESIVNVEVLSAHELDDAGKLAMQAALEKRFASQVIVKYSLDEALVGGAMIRAGNWVMDGSVRGKLLRMAESLRE